MNASYHGFGRLIDGKADKTLISSILDNTVGTLVIRTPIYNSQLLLHNRKGISVCR